MTAFLENGGNAVGRLWAVTLALYSPLSAVCWLGKDWMNSLGYVPWWLVFILGPPALLTAGGAGIWLYAVGTVMFVAGAGAFWLGASRDSDQGIWGLLAMVLVWVLWAPFWLAGAAA